jgi:AcrR family transcriptional regulator
MATSPRWSPNQQAVRDRIRDSAARVVAREGLPGCTVRAVADEAGLPKSTVHYYVVDGNELIDLAVLTFMRQLADRWQTTIEEEPDGPGALAVLVRMFLGRGPRVVTLKDPTIWSSYTTHAWKRGADAEVVACFELFSGLFEHVLVSAGVADAAERARSVHYYLLGAVQRNMVDPIPSSEVARSVSTLSGLHLDSSRC